MKTIDGTVEPAFTVTKELKMNITHFSIMQNSQYVGSVTIKEQAVHAAQSCAAHTGRPISVIAHIDDGRVREVVYLPGGTIERLWDIATEFQSLRQGGKIEMSGQIQIQMSRWAVANLIYKSSHFILIIAHRPIAFSQRKVNVADYKTILEKFHPKQKKIQVFLKNQLVILP